ncbi:right-handed parallel beta-helix repeat-containing protein [Chitinophagaceae bacterium 26-R-25]|nr:right-handed parallel beta-helix repeat-containing protein [Chitinophagaceae bacterium 26-R-25]
MKRFFTALFACSSLITFAQDKSANNKPFKYHQYHVSVNGNDANDGSISKPFKTIMAGANKAMPGDVITVHAGVYREQVAPPRGGISDQERIVYQAAKGENVTIKGSEIIKGWRRVGDNTWEVKITNTFFGKFNPYKVVINGDWFVPTPKDRKYLRGAVYLNGDWLMEAENKEEVFKTVDKKDQPGPSKMRSAIGFTIDRSRVTDEKRQVWFATVDSVTTTIWARFENIDPNKENVEINVRPTVFYPDQPFVNFITVRGFTMEQAATNWAPPTAEQEGVIGTHWSRGWIIENNCVQYSKCSGISLGKYGDEDNNKNTQSAKGFTGTINRALAFGWNKGTVGGHIVRNNTITHCEQSGIVGSMGCSFSIVQGNTIHDIYVRRLFDGAEMAGIKFHGGVDVQVLNNQIFRCLFGVWFDWMGQGAQVKNNLLYDNDLDMHLEVNHGPILVANNLFLSSWNMCINSQGVAFVHNIYGGRIQAYGYDNRITPIHKQHSTYIAAWHDNPGGDIQFINNLFVGEGNVKNYDKALLPVIMSGNVYTKGTNQEPGGQLIDWNMNLADSFKIKQKSKIETGELNKQNFDAAAKIIKEGDAVFLEISLDENWLTEQKRQLVTTQTLKPAILPNLPFENPDGSVLKIDTDYLGNKRNTANPSPGPFEILKTGKQTIKVWTK